MKDKSVSEQERMSIGARLTYDYAKSPSKWKIIIRAWTYNRAFGKD